MTASYALTTRKSSKASHTTSVDSTPVTKPRLRRTSVGVVRDATSAHRRLDQAVARIPGYPAGGARWVLEAKDGFWGTADWHRGTIYISPRVPASRMYDVVVHEWAHLLTAKVYGGDVQLAKLSTNRFFGGSGLTGAETAADCIARQLGAAWTHYTKCSNPAWHAGAAQLVAGQPV